MSLWINGQLAAVQVIDDVVFAWLGPRLIGGFSELDMAIESIVYAVEQAHTRSVPQRAA